MGDEESCLQFSKTDFGKKDAIRRHLRGNNCRDKWQRKEEFPGEMHFPRDDFCYGVNGLSKLFRGKISVSDVGRAETHRNDGPEVLQE